MSRLSSIGASVSVVLIALASAPVAHAVEGFDPIVANVGCVADADKASSADIDAFLSDPQKLLENHPRGGLELSNTVKTLVSSSSKAYASIMTLVSQSSDPQKSAIGAGLARAYGQCKDSQPDYAQAIGSDVADTRGSNLFLAFSAANNDPVVAAVASPGAASSALGGGETSMGNSQRSSSNGRQFGSRDPITNTASLSSNAANPSFVDSYAQDRNVSP
jgi:hypothetical protein